MTDATPNLAKSGPSIRTVTGWTILFMVLLRIAIGWHFFYEGAWKLMQDDWRATGYLTASAGPFRPLFTSMVKDADGLGRLTRENMYERMDRRQELAVKHCRLDEKQQEVLKTWVERKKHGIRDDNNISAIFDDPEFQQQLAEYRDKTAQGQPADRDAVLARFTPVFDDLQRAVESICTDEQKENKGDPPLMPSIVPRGVAEPDGLYWLTEKAKEEARKKQKEATGVANLSPEQEKELEKAYLYSQVDARYENLRRYYKLTDIQHRSTHAQYFRNQKRLGGRWDKNTVDAIWADPDFQQQLTEYKQFLGEIEAREKGAKIDYNTERLMYDYGKKSRARQALLARFEKPWNVIDPQAMAGQWEKLGLEAGLPEGFELSQEQLKAGPLPGEPSQTWFIDWSNMIALTVVGVCLMLGLLTRLAALGGIGLLAMYYLAMPPWPGLPESPMAEGHYLIVNKNLIEMIALFMIAVSRAGRWAGLDSYIGAILMRKTAPAPVPKRSDR